MDTGAIAVCSIQSGCPLPIAWMWAVQTAHVTNPCVEEPSEQMALVEEDCQVVLIVENQNQMEVEQEADEELVDVAEPQIVEQ